MVGGGPGLVGGEEGLDGEPGLDLGRGQIREGDGGGRSRAQGWDLQGAGGDLDALGLEGPGEPQMGQVREVVEVGVDLEVDTAAGRQEA